MGGRALGRREAAREGQADQGRPERGRQEQPGDDRLHRRGLALGRDRLVESLKDQRIGDRAERGRQIAQRPIRAGSPDRSQGKLGAIAHRAARSTRAAPTLRT
jgi:hypothetical protein